MSETDTPFDRIVPLEGGHNFRDIGGYPTADGRVVACGLVYRSGTLSELSDRDHVVMDALGLAVICDFRSTRERERRPSRLPEAARYEIWSRDHPMSAADLTEAMRRPDATSDSSRALMIAAYRDLAYEQVPSYQELFRRIAYGPLPLMFHCAAGKDRTGIAAGLLLDLLGVARDQVLADYAITDRFFARGCELVAKDPFGTRLAGINPRIWEPMMRADPAYLAAMFDTIETRHGSGEGFIRDALGMDDTAIAAIRARLLPGR